MTNTTSSHFSSTLLGGDSLLFDSALRDREVLRATASPEREDRFFTALETFTPSKPNASIARDPPMPYTSFPILWNQEHPFYPSSYLTTPATTALANPFPFQRHHPLRSYPHPRHFITGTEALALECPGPSAEEVEEYRLASETTKWQNLLLALSRWAMQHKECNLRGEDDVLRLSTWDNSLFQFFTAWSVCNCVMKAKLAVTTFEDNAAAWWTSHMR